MNLRQMIKNKVFQKQFAAYFVALLIVVSIIGYVIFSAAYATISDQSEKYHATLVNGVKESIDNHFNEIYNLNIQLFGTPWFVKLANMKHGINSDLLDEYDLKNIYEELGNYKAANSFIAEIFIYLKNSKTIISNYGKDDLRFFEKYLLKDKTAGANNIYHSLEEPVYSKVMPNVQLSIGDMEYSAVAFTKSSSVSREISVVTIVKKQEIKQFLDKISKDVFIIDSSNNIIAGDSFITNQKSLTDYSQYPSGSGILYKNIDGVKYILSFSESGINNWKYVEVVPVNHIYDKAIRFRNLFISMFIFSIIFGFVLIIILTKRSLDPIQKIVNAIGRLNENKPEKNNSLDLKVLEQSFNRLLYEKDTLKQEVEKYQPILKNSYLLKLVKGDMDSYEWISQYGIQLSDDYFIVAILEMEFIDSTYTNSVMKLTEVIVVLIETLNSALNELGYKGYAFDYEADKVVFIINTSDADEIEASMFRVLNILREKVEASYHTVITIGIGNRYDAVDKISWSFQEAFQALNYKLVSGKGKLIAYRDIVTDHGHSYFYPLEMEVRLVQSAKSGNYPKVEALLDGIVHENLVNRKLDLNSIKYLFYDLEATVIKVANEMYPSGLPNVELINGMSNLNSVEEMITYIKQIFIRICEGTGQKKDDQIKSLVKDILDHMENNYTDSNFSLEAASKLIGTSKSFISRIFKEQTGQYYSDYLNKLRMNKAKELLETTEMQVKDIAKDVGYVNDITFRRIFKQNEGLTPGEFREAIRVK